MNVNTPLVRFHTALDKGTVTNVSGAEVQVAGYMSYRITEEASQSD